MIPIATAALARVVQVAVSIPLTLSASLAICTSDCNSNELQAVYSYGLPRYGPMKLGQTRTSRGGWGWGWEGGDLCSVLKIPSHIIGVL